MGFDVFISHASEDKEDFVRPLAAELTRRGLRVWYDEWTLQLGDGLRNKIDQGLANSNFGVVVLSRDFFAKKWPKAELDGLFAREMQGGKVILPIWHRVTKEEVLGYSPMLAGKMAASTDLGVDAVADQILAVTRPADSNKESKPRSPGKRAEQAGPPNQPLSELLRGISDVAPLLYKLDAPLEGTNARIFFGALQEFFGGGSILTVGIDDKLRFGADNLLRVISNAGDPAEHQKYLFGKLATARSYFEEYRQRMNIGYELSEIDPRNRLAMEMQQLHATMLQTLDDPEKMSPADRLLVRLVVALLEYGRSQHDPQQPYPSIGPGIHQSLRELLTLLLARHLNVALPDRLENILTGDVRAIAPQRGMIWRNSSMGLFGEQCAFYAKHFSIGSLGIGRER